MNDAAQKEAWQTRRTNTQAWWATFGDAADAHDLAQAWPIRARAFEALAFHDFFDGPGLADTITLVSAGMLSPYHSPSHVRGVTHVDLAAFPLVRILREAVTRADLRGRIRLTVSKTSWEDGGSYLKTLLSVLDYSLLPKIARLGLSRVPRPYLLYGPDDRTDLCDLVNVTPSLVEGLWGAMQLFLMEPEHPLTPHLLDVMRGVSHGSGVATWPAWSQVAHEKGWPWEGRTPAHYGQIPQWPVQHVPLADAQTAGQLLQEGVVIQWPPTGQRVRIQFMGAIQTMYGEGRLILNETSAPLTPTVKRNGPGTTVRVFGEGLTQQDAQIPTVGGKETVAVLSWWDPERDVTTTITATIGPNGLPELAWVDESDT